jgi:hypothetical protein
MCTLPRFHALTRLEHAYKNLMERGFGCREFAVFMMEAARHKGSVRDL